MYDYMKALQKRFDHQSHPELDTQIKSAQEELRRDTDAAGRRKLLRLLFIESFLQGFHVVVHGDPSFGSQHTYHNSGRKAITFSRIIFIYSGAFLQMFL